MVSDSARDRGMASTEFAVICGAFVLFASTVLVAGKVAQSEIDIRNAAQEAARAATLQRDVASAELAATSTAVAQASQCESINVAVSTDGFQPGGSVTVTLTCVADVMFGSRTMSATAKEVIDVYRATS